MALTLQRRRDESIQIGDDITVTIAEISPGRVVLRIDCPASTVVYRPEMQQAKVNHLKQRAAKRAATNQETRHDG